MANDTDQQVTLARPRTQDPNVSSVSPMRPPRLQNIARLLAFENVQVILAAGDIGKLKVAAEFKTGERDAKTINVGDGGSVLIVVLNDNPANVGDRFWDVRPPRVTPQEASHE